ncbi:MAG: aspartate aminotransferase family protein [Rhodospirillaceae bacterium]|nr:aspartate aminotransferase family protein [Rhodospirillaceae bacterium]
MDNEPFRRHAHEIVDWMADYMGDVESYPVRAQVRPGDIAAQLPMAAPDAPEPMDAIFQDFKDIVMPGITHWQHPSFFAYFPANSSPPSVLAEMLTATLAANCLLWQTSPAATEMETRILDWLRQMIGLDDGFTGVIQDSASSASLCAILTARERATEWRANENGLSEAAPLSIYASTETHSSVEKDAKVAGIGRQFVRKISVDSNFAMRPDELAQAIAVDRAEGVTPAMVVATLGTTGVGAIDPLRAIGDICKREDLYLHVDAAWAGSALILDDYRWMIDGIEAVDSFVFNPHKWLLTNFDCSAHFIRDPDALVRTLSILPEYLKTQTADDVIDYRDWSVPLGRRFRALKLWFVLRSYGVDGLRRMIADHITWAEELAGLVDAAPDFEIASKRNLALFNFRYRPMSLDNESEIDALNETLLNAINDDGRLYLTQNRVNGRYVIRFCVGQTNTTRDHVLGAWDVIQEIARGL